MGEREVELSKGAPYTRLKSVYVLTLIAAKRGAMAQTDEKQVTIPNPATCRGSG
jgi:hypothetical protein